MSWLYRTFARPALFAQDSEEIHNRTLHALSLASRHEVLCDCLEAFWGAPALPIETFGLRFPNPVGLAAGMDKHAVAVPAWQALGFGFAELGGVTLHPQPGNPPPRIFRVVAAEGLINRMGFNNPGAQAIAEKLAEWRRLGRWPRHPVGINLGKSKITPLEKAADDYAGSLRLLWSRADFFVVNVSSPNTPNLRQLQERAALDEILAALQEVNDLETRRRVGETANRREAKPAPMLSSPTRRHADTPTLSHKPILVKVAPDLSFEALDELLELIGPRQVAGIVATNTTVARPETTDASLKRVYFEQGGLSGRPLRQRSTEVIRHVCRQTKGKVPIVGVGGIFNADDAWEKIKAGASLVQVYTGLIYEGPSIAREIVTGLRTKLVEAGLSRLEDVVGKQ